MRETGLRDLSARQEAVEAWLRTEVAGAYDALHEDSSRALSVPEVRDTFAARITPVW
jgi:antitoxin ParD1/3/4